MNAVGISGLHVAKTNHVFAPNVRALTGTDLKRYDDEIPIETSVRPALTYTKGVECIRIACGEYASIAP